MPGGSPICGLFCARRERRGSWGNQRLTHAGRARGGGAQGGRARLRRRAASLPGGSSRRSGRGRPSGLPRRSARTTARSCGRSPGLRPRRARRPSCSSTLRRPCSRSTISSNSSAIARSWPARPFDATTRRKFVTMGSAPVVTSSSTLAFAAGSSCGFIRNASSSGVASSAEASSSSWSRTTSTRPCPCAAS